MIEDGSAQNKILDAARKVFAERGYDGASISEIAKRAGVNKALPFYYFGSKENILREIVKQSSKENLERQEMYMRHADPMARETIEEYYDHLISMLEAKKDTVRILLTETLKGSEQNTVLFDFLDPVLKGVKSKLDAMGIPVKDPQRLMTTELFFDAVPLFMYSALYEKWAAYNGIPEDKVKEDFKYSFKKIYVDYLFNLYFKRYKEEK